jgi:hypothetical protein
MQSDDLLRIEVVNEPHRLLPFRVYAGPHLLAECPDTATLEQARSSHVFARLRVRLLAGAGPEGAEAAGQGRAMTASTT